MSNLMHRPLAALAATLVLGALPALAAPAAGPNFTGAWEDPNPQEILRPPGSPPLPQEVGPPPLKPEPLAAWNAQRKKDAEATARGEPPVGNGVKCIPGGMPSMMKATFPIEVLQTPGQVTIINEAFAQIRRIYLDEKQIAVEDAEPLFWGHSVGHWEGNTLVVNTIGIKENVKFRDVPHSANMKIDERITVTSPTTFEDRITITDPEYLTAPWTWTYKFVRKADYKINEYVCEDDRIYQDPVTGLQRLRVGE